MKKVIILLFCILPFMLPAQPIPTTADSEKELVTAPPSEKTELSPVKIQTENVTIVNAATPTTGEGEPSFIQKLIDWFTKNWGYIVGALGIIEIIVRLTPSEKDNAYFAWFSNLLDSLIPNMKKGGGTHTKNKA